MKKIFCIGFPKTATTSLEEALIYLGYNVCKGHYANNHSNYLVGLYMHQDYEELNKIIEYFDAFCDIPWGGTDFYKYLDQKYPDALFIHTVRNADKWYGSLETMLTEFDDNLNSALDTFHKQARYGATNYIRKEFKIHQLANNKEKIIQHYKDKNEMIEKHFQERPSKYLKMDITIGDSWQRLCEFIGKEVPKIEFPNVNKAESFKGDEQAHQSRPLTVKTRLYKLKRRFYKMLNIK